MTEKLLGGRAELELSEDVFPLTTDTMLLADFAEVRRGARVIDLGCGSGALGLLLRAHEEDFSYFGIDCSPEACRLTEENLRRNGCPCETLCCRFAGLPNALNGSADLVIANPPYFPPSRGKSGTEARTGAEPEEWLTCAAGLLKDGGHLCFCYPAEWGAELLPLLKRLRLEPKRLRLTAHSPAHPPKLLLADCVRGGKPGLKLLPLLFLYREDGSKSGDYLRIYHEESIF